MAIDLRAREGGGDYFNPLRLNHAGSNANAVALYVMQRDGGRLRSRPGPGPRPRSCRCPGAAVCAAYSHLCRRGEAESGMTYLFTTSF
jgi:hypothetical protein